MNQLSALSKLVIAIIKTRNAQGTKSHLWASKFIGLKPPTPLRNGSIFYFFLVHKTCAEDKKFTSRIVTGHSLNNIQDGDILVFSHLTKIKVAFFEPRRPSDALALFIIFGERKSGNNA